MTGGFDGTGRAGRPWTGTPWARSFIVLGAAACLAGIALSAMAAHVTGGGNLDTAARFLLVHGPALLALAALDAGGLLHKALGRIAGVALVAGLVLFCGDLSVRALTGIAPWRLAAPTGGLLLMAGWLAVGIAALVPRGGSPEG